MLMESLQAAAGSRGGGCGIGEHITKGHEETLKGDGYDHYFDYGDDFTGISICYNLSNCFL